MKSKNRLKDQDGLQRARLQNPGPRVYIVSGPEVQDRSKEIVSEPMEGRSYWNQRWSCARARARLGAFADS